ncbi:MAG: hypothetical protein ACK5Y2_04395 [Bdellovibrionales bacterium]
MKLKTVFVNSILVLASVGLTLAAAELLAPRLVALLPVSPQKPDPSPRIYFDFQTFPRKTQFDVSKVPQKALEKQAYVDPTDKDYAGMFKNGDMIYADNFKLLPNKSVEIDLKQISTGKSLFQGRYSTDALGRRLTLPQVDGAQALVVDGCSFTFGDVIQDHETLPSQLQKILPKTKVVNLGFPGRSPASSYYAANLDNWKIVEDLKDKQTVLVYVFIDFHIDRILANSSWMRDKLHYAQEPIYRLENDKLVFKGLSDEYYSGLFGAVFKWYTRSQFYSTFRRELLHYDRAYKMKLTSELIQEYFKSAATALKTPKKFLVIHPWSWNYNQDLKELLSGTDVKILDYSAYDVQKLLNGHDRTLEGHPSPLLNELLAHLILADIKEQTELR